MTQIKFCYKFKINEMIKYYFIEFKQFFTICLKLSIRPVK